VLVSISLLPVALASLSLVAVAVGLGRWFRLGIERDLVVASLRAAVQLLAVGALFTAIFESSRSMLWAWLWVIAMAVMATVVIVRRSLESIRSVPTVAALSIVTVLGITLAVTFGFGVLEFDSVELVVIAGITIGNAVPSAVLGLNQAIGSARDRSGEIEALLSLGFDRTAVVRQMAPRAARAALIPQIERTKVVGLIALPGAMTGLLLAGVEPIDAVAVQLLVMYLVLGSAAVCVVALVATVMGDAVDRDLVTAPWVRDRG
jgi:putative ABC transport system permease protein